MVPSSLPSRPPVFCWCLPWSESHPKPERRSLWMASTQGKPPGVEQDGEGRAWVWSRWKPSRSGASLAAPRPAWDPPFHTLPDSSASLSQDCNYVFVPLFDYCLHRTHTLGVSSLRVRAMPGFFHHFTSSSWLKILNGWMEGWWMDVWLLKLGLNSRFHCLFKSETLGKLFNLCFS